MSDFTTAHPIQRAQALTAASPSLAPRTPVRPGAIQKPEAMSEAEFTAIRKTAQEFESMMLGEMLTPMFKGLDTGGLFGGGQAEETWRGLMVQEYGAEISRSGGVGIADQVVRQLLQIQESE